MTKTLLDALQTRDNRTENNMVTNSSTLNFCVDLFFSIGAMRGQSEQRLISLFSKAFNENPLTALKILFWARDVRGGAGERQIFKTILRYLAENHPETLLTNLIHIPEYGRWDDLLCLFGTNLDKEAKLYISEALKSNNGLASKWMPRKGKDAIALERFMKLSPKQYRKLLVENTKVVEQQMCAKKWDNIIYEHVPSLAMGRYTNAFNKHDQIRFNEYKNGNTKVNSSAVYPYDVIKTLRFGDVKLAEKQWDALPNYMQNNNELILPVCDTSGSMRALLGNSSNLTCLDACVSLGLYISERNIGKFKDAFITFSLKPELQYINGSLNNRYHQLKTADWGMNTDLSAVFKLILNQATKFHLPQSEMPTMILIMSDMEFDQATNDDYSAMDLIASKYADAGYKLPKIVFWNISSRNDGNYPVQFKDNNTALISGLSPAILRSILSGEDITPIGTMNQTINNKRYDLITIE